MPDTANPASTVLNLGPIDGPVLIFGGPYSNQQATEALLQRAKILNIPAERIICTGDVVAYCAAPVETTDLVRHSGMHVVQGNCELSFGEDANNCGCGFAEGTTCNRLSTQWYDYARQKLSAQDAAWMRGLPGQIRFETGGRKLAVVHATPSSVNRFVFASTPLADKLAKILRTGCDGVVCGHSGLPFSQVIDEKLWHNAGVIGLPANDGTRRTWFSVISPDENGIHIDHMPLTYDASGASDEMKSAELATEYASTLTTGLWDNCDILPDEETRQQGKALSFSPFVWQRLQQAAE